MKTKIVFLGGMILAMLMLSNCSDETGGKITPPDEGIPTQISLIVKTTTKDVLSRAETYPSEEQEALIVNRKIKLYVYDDEGKLEYKNEDLTLETDYTTIVTLKTGQKYFYVLANTVNSANSDAAGIKPMSMIGAYEKQLVDIAFGTDKSTPDLTTPNFILSTLWREKKTIPTVNNVPLVLNIGRMVGKVKLCEVDKGSNYSIMEGEFKNPEYRIGSVPTTCFWVGQYDHGNGANPPPPGNNGVYGAVESAVHEAKPIEGTGQNPLFHNYEEWETVSPMPTTGNPMQNSFYIVENTTKKDGKSLQYYGNTTYIRLKTVYEPTLNEIWDATLSSKGQTLTGGSFWTIIHNGERYITNARPSDELTDEDTEIKYYEYGVNYHKFAIKDTRQSDVEKRHSVYRNHFYQISVTGIRDLGDPTDIVDPEEPIPSEEEVTVSVKVIDWSNITQEEDI